MPESIAMPLNSSDHTTAADARPCPNAEVARHAATTIWFKTARETRRMALLDCLEQGESFRLLNILLFMSALNLVLHLWSGGPAITCRPALINHFEPYRLIF